VTDDDDAKAKLFKLAGRLRALAAEYDGSGQLRYGSKQDEQGEADAAEAVGGLIF
jgi:hypothetical protein